MSIKDYLSRFNTLNKEIDSKVAELEVWRSKAENITMSTSDGGGGARTTSAKFEPIVDKLIKLENEINREIETLISYRKQISNLIERVNDDTYRTLLRYRYISGCTFEQIAVKMNYSWRWTISLHGRALQAAAEVASWQR